MRLGPFHQRATQLLQRFVFGMCTYISLYNMRVRPAAQLVCIFVSCPVLVDNDIF
eukprot:NODE_5028_length_326_cov_166.032491_g4417_i0.p2 GENE.NODE_5028_length_326_cov_166.032491_g4417_i0~~NODE_5028_length_326_cov_166.032491_g4417_i0.p2  ORF type:complete len:55 (-),score=4.52 NODE_5028_length_326_cov_166.032491_g4417_i0:63-227(-)